MRRKTAEKPGGSSVDRWPRLLPEGTRRQYAEERDRAGEATEEAAAMASAASCYPGGTLGAEPEGAKDWNGERKGRG